MIQHFCNGDFTNHTSRYMLSQEWNHQKLVQLLNSSNFSPPQKWEDCKLSSMNIHDMFRISPPNHFWWWNHHWFGPFLFGPLEDWDHIYPTCAQDHVAAVQDAVTEGLPLSSWSVFQISLIISSQIRSCPCVSWKISNHLQSSFQHWF